MAIETVEELNEAVERMMVRSRAIMRWYDTHPASVVPPLVTRAEMLALSAEVGLVDEWLSQGRGLPERWKRKDRPELQSSCESLLHAVVARFMGLQTPVSVPQEHHEARQLLSEWLINHAQPIPDESYRWLMAVVDNGYYVFETDDHGVVVKIDYEEGL